MDEPRRLRPRPLTVPAPVPMLDLAAQHAALCGEIEAGLRTVLASGRFVLGAQGADFEREAADYLGVAHAVGCGSGTDALLLSLRALGIGAGDEVVTSPFTFFATAEAIAHTGARPVFVDIDPHTFNLDPAQVAAAIGPATRAILPVHLFGQPAAIEPLQALAQRHRLPLIEDCAQAFGARRGGRMCGGFGDAGCFSFYPSKNLGACGDGGLIVTGSAALAAELRALRNHGAHADGRPRSLGWNSRLDELQAAVLRAKLKRIDAYNAARRRVAQRYDAGLAGLADLRTPFVDPDGTHIYHQYTVLVPERERVRADLAAAGIQTAVHYACPLHREPAFATGRAPPSLPVAESVAQHCLSLPIWPELDDTRIDRVVDVLRTAIADESAG